MQYVLRDIEVMQITIMYNEFAISVTCPRGSALVATKAAAAVEAVLPI